MIIPIPNIYAIRDGCTTPFLPPYSRYDAALPIYGEARLD